MSRIAVASIAAKNYLAPARVLAASLREHHPEVPFFLLLADEPQGCFEPADEPFPVAPLSDLPIPAPEAFRFRHDRMHVCVASKPWLIAHLLDRGFDAVLYLDADMLVTGDLSAVLDAVARRPLSLTPHHLSPVPGADGTEEELKMLRAGAFNAGCVGVSASETGRRFITWWAHRIYATADAGVFHDQHWLDLAPAMFEGVGVLRDPGLNVAYWNLVQRGLRVEAGRPMVGGEPCRLIHFSGLKDAPEGGISRHSSLRLNAIGSAAEVFERYTALLAEAGHETTRAWPYAFDRFADGSAVPQAARRLYGRCEAPERFGDPFATGAGSFVEWLNGPVDGLEPPISRFWMGVRDLRADLQRAFPDAAGNDRERFLAWTRETGRRECGAPEILW